MKKVRCKDCTVGMLWAYEGGEEINVSDLSELNPPFINDSYKHNYCPVCGLSVKVFWKKAGCDYIPPIRTEPSLMGKALEKQSQEIWTKMMNDHLDFIRSKIVKG